MAPLLQKANRMPTLVVLLDASRFVENIVITLCGKYRYHALWNI